MRGLVSTQYIVLRNSELIGPPYRFSTDLGNPSEFLSIDKASRTSRLPKFLLPSARAMSLGDEERNDRPACPHPVLVGAVLVPPGEYASTLA